MTDRAQVERHYASDGITGRVLTALRNVNGPDVEITPDILAPIDHFHGRGVAATEELAALLQPKAGDYLLDIGCGIAGPARWIAEIWLSRHWSGPDAGILRRCARTQCCYWSCRPRNHSARLGPCASDAGRQLRSCLFAGGADEHCGQADCLWGGVPRASLWWTARVIHGRCRPGRRTPLSTAVGNHARYQLSGHTG